MSSFAGLGLDANIAIRFALGRRVRLLMRRYRGRVIFYVPEICLSDARRHVFNLASVRAFNLANAMANMDEFESSFSLIPASDYAPYEFAARPRISPRDEDDWPIIATALQLECPIWTEDQDFFGCGIATWTTDKVEIFFQQG